MLSVVNAWGADGEGGFVGCRERIAHLCSPHEDDLRRPRPSSGHSRSYTGGIGEEEQRMSVYKSNIKKKRKTDSWRP